MDMASINRRIIRVKTDRVFFSLGDHAHSIPYLEFGRGKIPAAAKRGREVIASLLSAEDFICGQIPNASFNFGVSTRSG
jgi:hypothetical protein